MHTLEKKIKQCIICARFPHFRPSRIQAKGNCGLLGGKSTLPRGGHLGTQWLQDESWVEGTSAKKKKKRKKNKLFPQGYLQARHIRSSIHNTVKRNKDGGSTHHQVLLLLLLSIPLTIIKEKEELLLLSQLTFFNMLTVLVLLNCTEYNSLRDSTGLADGRRRVQMVHTSHTQ